MAFLKEIRGDAVLSWFGAAWSWVLRLVLLLHRRGLSIILLNIITDFDLANSLIFILDINDKRLVAILRASLALGALLIFKLQSGLIAFLTIVVLQLLLFARG